jgi:cell division protease FtsH
VVVDAPDLEGRDAILKIHTRGKPLAPDVDLHKIAQETPGFSGADLANVMNEAALLTARHDGKQIGQKDLEEAVEKVVAGPERKSRRLNAADKRRVDRGHLLASSDPHERRTNQVGEDDLAGAESRGRAELRAGFFLPNPFETLGPERRLQ